MTIQPTPSPKPPLSRRTFAIDGVRGGYIAVSETPDFNHVTLSIHHPNHASVNIELDSQHFGELSYLKYVLNMAGCSPF